MWVDDRLEFCDSFASSSTAGSTRLLGDQIPLSQARDIGNGEPMCLVIQVTESFASTGSPTGQFKLVSDDSSAISTTGAATEHFATEAIALATLVAGYTRVVALPMEPPAYEAFLGILLVTATADFTAGEINAFLTKDVAKWKAYADGI